MKTEWYELAKARMSEVGITQAQLSEELGVTQGALSHWLNGRRSASLAEIGSIFRILGIVGATLNIDGSFTIGPDNSRHLLSLIMNTLFSLTFRQVCFLQSSEPLQNAMQKAGSVQLKSQ